MKKVFLASVCTVVAGVVTFVACGKKESGDAAAPVPTATPATGASLTYTGQIKAILDAKCVTCHAAGKQASYKPLDTFALAAASKADIKSSTDGSPAYMPKSSSPQLTATEKANIDAWVSAGAPN
jgi:mono/diheme cytochrome c family protein